MNTYLGIEIGGTKLQVVLGDQTARIIERRRCVVDRNAGAAGIRAQIESALVELAPAGKPCAVGVGYGGPVNARTGRIARSYHISGWSDFDLAGWLRSLTGVPAIVDNDANVAALGEALMGAGRGCNPVFYVTLGSGVGGGLVCDGKLYHGTVPGECELGHVRLSKDGTIVEARCAGWAVDRRIRAAVAAQPRSVLAQLVGAAVGGEARHLKAALDAGDALAQGIFEDLVSDLGFALAHVTQLFHPEIIVLGGGLALMGDVLAQGVARVVPKYIMDVYLPGPRIALAALGEDAVPVGALLLARESGAGIAPALSAECGMRNAE